VQKAKTVDNRLSRQEIAQKLSEYEKAIQSCPSQRQIAEEIDIPRSTIQHWLNRKSSIDADPEVVTFFESPAGTAFLHRLVLGAQFVITQVGPCGIRLVCQYLELTGLDQFVASSYGTQQKVSVQMEQALVEFDEEEKMRLAEGMKPKEITICQDENFHSDPCLVAIEPVSNFILLEKYSESRKAHEWTKAMEEALKGLLVEIVQSTSDEGKGIVHHVEKDLGSHHSPDVFHVENEIVKGTSAPLASKTKRASEALEKAAEKVNWSMKEKEAYFSNKRGPGRPPDFDKRIEEARNKENDARQCLLKAEEHQKQMKDAIKGISEAYHPFELGTARMRSAEEVSRSLNQCFSKIEDVATDAALSEGSFKRIKKAKKVVVDMVATIVFYLLAIRAKVEALSLVPEVEEAVFENLIPSIYLHLVSEKAKSAEVREQLRRKSEELLEPLRAVNGPFSGLVPHEIGLIEQVSQECACLFQRSSSCVEGRNGQLALRHHSLHRLSDRKLAALTAVHNYYVKRSDGTTAAERFFGAKPRDLFEYLLDRLDLPARPAQKRSQREQKKHFLVAA
jgi:hypothetical protein